jgi:hypothetical protein
MHLMMWWGKSLGKWGTGSRDKRVLLRCTCTAGGMGWLNPARMSLEECGLFFKTRPVAQIEVDTQIHCSTGM